MIRNVRFGNLYSNLLQQNNNQQKQELINRNYNEIYAHEQAHKSAGGALAGAIVIEKNSDGIPVGGHVAIKMPVLNPNNPQKTIDEANIVVDKASGKDLNRVGFQALKGPLGLRKGDTLVIKSLDRLSRNKADIKNELEWFKENQVNLQILDLPTTMIQLPKGQE